MARTMKVRTGSKAILALKHATGLTLNEARTVVYWAVATHGLSKLGVFPPLVIYGPIETGKSTILKFLPQLIDAHVISTTTKAEFRDQLANNRIVCIEEGDNVNEELILKRYSRETGQLHLKVRGSWGFYTEKGNLYGATILHRRHTFEDLALQSRAITIKTRKVQGKFLKTKLPDDYKDRLRKLWKRAWKHRSGDVPSGRTETNWWPLVIVAQFRGDDKWIDYANKQKRNAEYLLKGDSEFEPDKVLANALDYFKGKGKKFVYLSTLIEHLNNHYMWKPTSKRVAKILREEMDYTVKHRKLGHAVKLS
jgi:hypothetical protein